MMRRDIFLVLAAALYMASPAGAESAPVPKSVEAGAQQEKSAAAQTSQLKVVDAVTGMEFVAVPGGCFRMGSDSGNSDERPVHDVCLSPFHIGKFEVTQGQWRKVMGSNPSRFDRCGDNCPVEQVSWNDAQEFIDRLNSATGKKFRLPTEAEWEYACRSGGKADIYCGGSDIDALAWYGKNGEGKTHRVGLKQPNQLGVHDMSGNVWEWVLDWKGEYPKDRQQDPAGASWSSTRVRRGGSWQYGSCQAHSTWRSSGYPDDHALDLGLRLVLPTRTLVE